MKILLSYLVVFCLLRNTLSVDRNNFKTCDQSSFCRRCRSIQPDDSPYDLVAGSLNIYSDSITADLINRETGHLYSFKLEGVKHDVFRVLIDEKTPLKARYRVKDALKGPVEPDTVKVVESAEKQIIVTCGNNKAIVHATPFKLDFYRDDKLVVSANSKGLFRFEHLRAKPAPSNLVENQPEEVKPEDVKPESKDPADTDSGAWEENFKSHSDAKPNGPEAVALDFSFPRAKILAGIPEHADSFALRSTVGSEPYRLYNLDVFEYELNNGMALYGSVPVIYGHGPDASAGVYWQNPSETWVDIHNSNSEKNVISSIVNMVSGSGESSPLTAHFISESGIVDVFILMGPNPIDTYQQYTSLTGTHALPPLFSLAYHQSRWNYNDEKDVNDVSNNFDVHDIPMDTMWLDIEYTDAKKYFTWDPHKFAHPLEMIANLTVKGRHLTIIIDPHIKRDGGYFFHNHCTDNGYYTKNKDGNDYEGWCWPGAASYPDLFNPVVRKYFADQYLLENFKTTTAEVMLWNDMNEPSVFNGPEVTMPKDNIHYEGFEHRHVHNLYGHMQLTATYDGLLRRSNNKLRPFILSRSHFSGSQRYAAIWTGDNFADWAHLAVSVKMCLSEAVGGFSFCGADVGGFFGNPDEELFYRWYQAGAYQPFFRAHSHIDTRRREPWLTSEPTKLLIRDAIRQRYTFLPLWYTLFFEHERNGVPVMRPLIAHYPLDQDAYAIDNEYLLSDQLLVRPITQPGATSIDVYFPRKTTAGEGEIWYEVNTFQKVENVGMVTLSVTSSSIPVFQRGGSIIPKKERVRRAATLMIDDPYTFVVCLDKGQSANGTLYLDDEKTFDYRSGKYIYTQLQFKNNVLTSKYIDKNASYDSKSWVERIVIAGLSATPKSAKLEISTGENVELEVYKSGNTIVVRKPGVSITKEWKITLNY